MKIATTLSPVYSIWGRLPLIVRAIVSGCLVCGIGVFAWGALLSGFPGFWVILPMTIFLWAYWKFFSGRWGSANRSKVRKELFRLTNLSKMSWKLGLASAILFVLIVQASFVITFRLIEFPSAKFMADYKLVDTFPTWVAWAIIIMGSIVAGICEETGFRGYMQVRLEKKYGSVAGIVISSIVFTLIHLSHTWARPILPHIFFASVLLGIIAYKTGSLIPGIIGHSILDIFDYSVWWTDLTGGFKMQTIFKTGVDLNFILWTLIFAISLFAFFKVMGKFRNAKEKVQAITLLDILASV